MHYLDSKECITSLFSLLDEFTKTKQTVISRKRPNIYLDACLLVFSVMMTLKRINEGVS